jgi:glucose/arabinose dehydrogenase
MRRVFGGVAFSLLALSLASTGFAQSPTGQPSAQYTVSTVAEGLDHPWSLAFLPDGSMLVTERAGRLRVIRNGQLVPEAIAGVPEVLVGGQGGLFDVVLHPQFATNKVLFLAYAKGESGANATHVARAYYDGSGLTEVKDIFVSTPLKETMNHYGGRMAFLPDGTLIVALGDGFNHREEAQNLNSHLGKIVRINEDGSVPQDNPFVGRSEARPEIWSYGHRNVQGLVYDTLDNRLYEHEHGPRGGDELNLVERGKNYGWPVITYGIDYSGAIISPFKEREGMEQPLLYWDPSIAPSGLAIYRGLKFPAWSGDLFVGALAHMKVVRVNMEGGKVAGQEDLFGELGKRIRDVREGPDGFLYLTTDEEGGSVLRVEPKT